MFPKSSGSKKNDGIIWKKGLQALQFHLKITYKTCFKEQSYIISSNWFIDSWCLISRLIERRVLFRLKDKKILIINLTVFKMLIETNFFSVIIPSYGLEWILFFFYQCSKSGNFSSSICWFGNRPEKNINFFTLAVSSARIKIFEFL